MEVEMVRGTTMYKDGKIFRHDEIPSIHGIKIGSNFERTKLDPKWNYLKKLNHLDHKRSKEIEASHEIFRIKSMMGIHIRSRFIFTQYKKYYSQLTPTLAWRGFRNLVPVAIFITLKENFIFFKPSNLYKLMECKRTTFNKTLKEVYRNNPEIYKFFKSNYYRKTYIHQTLIALSNHFNFRGEFLELSKNLLDEYFPDFKNHPNHSIVLFIYALSKRRLKDNLGSNPHQVALFLGTQSSVLSNNKKVWMKE